MDLFRCCLLILLAVAATPTLAHKSKGSVFLVQKPTYLQNPSELLNGLSSKFTKPKPVFVKPTLPNPGELLSGLSGKFIKPKPVFTKPVVVKPIVVVKPVIVGGGGAVGGGGGHGHGHGHGHHGKNKFFGKF